MVFIDKGFDCRLILLFSFIFYTNLQTPQYCWNFQQTPNSSSQITDTCSGVSVLLNYQPIKSDKYCKSAGCTLGSLGYFQTKKAFQVGNSITISLWILAFGNNTSPLPILRLATSSPPFMQILQIEHVQSNGSFQSSCSSDTLNIYSIDDESMRSLYWQQIFVSASFQNQSFQLSAFDTSSQSSDFISRTKTISDCFQGLNSKTQANLIIGSKEEEESWEGIIKQLNIIGKSLTMNEMKHLLVKQSYPQLLFKGNYIGAKNEIDVEFRNGEMLQYTQSNAKPAEYSSSQPIIDSLGRTSTAGKAIKIKGLNCDCSLFIQAWFHFNEPSVFFPFIFRENEQSLKLEKQVAQLIVNRIAHQFQVPLFSGWNYISLQFLNVDDLSPGFVYFVVNSFISPVFETDKGFISLHPEVAHLFTGHLNRLRLSYQPRGRRSFFFIGRETPLCLRTQYYDGNKCQDCHYTCPYCASLSDAYCFANTQFDSLFSICPSGYHYSPKVSYCEPNEACIEYQQNDCTKCVQNFKVRAGKCVERCIGGQIETKTHCKFAIGFEKATLISRNVLLLQYSEEILASDQLFAFLTSEISVMFSKSINFRLKLISPRNQYQKNIKIKVQVLDVIYQGERVEMELRIRKRDSQGNQDRQNPFINLYSLIKPQYSEAQQAQIAQFSQATQASIASMGGVMSFNFITGILLDLSLKQLWGLINIAQLLSYQLMICVPKPYNLVVFLQNLIIANGDLKIVQQFGQMLDISLFENLETQFPDEPFECFEQADFESSGFLLNQEISIYLVTLYLGIIVPISCIVTKLCGLCRFRCSRYFVQKFKTCYSCGALERLLLELYLDLSISIFIGIDLFKIQSTLQIFDTAVRLISLLLLVTGFVIYKIIILI